jgi:hypothetical protein
MRAVSEQFDKSVERKAKGPKFIDFKKPGKYVVRVLPSRNYPNDLQWFRKLDRHFSKPEGTSDMLFNSGDHTCDAPCPIYKAIKAVVDSILNDIAARKFGKGMAKSSAKYLINVVTPDKPDVVQTAEVPQKFIKFLRTFQETVNMLFCDPTHGNLIAFEAFPAANGFGNEYKILKQQPMPTNFSGKQIPDLDKLLKAAIDDIRPVSAFTGNLLAPLAATSPAPGTGFQAPGGFTAPAPTPAAPAADAFAGFAAATPATSGAAASAMAATAQAAASPPADPSTKAAGLSDPFATFASNVPAPPVIDGTFAAIHAAAAPAAPPAFVVASPVSGISDADAARLKAQLLAMIGQG